MEGLEQKRLIKANKEKQQKTEMATEEEKLLSYCFKTVGEMEEERKNEKYWEMFEKVLDKIFEEKKIVKKEKDWTEVWSYVIKQLKNMPFCELQHRPTKMFICFVCDWASGSCVECRKKGKHHQLLDPKEARELYKPVVEQYGKWEPYDKEFWGKKRVSP